MTSEIISTTIDENFPVAGQDNDSQGFRDNFNIVKAALAVAGTEITDLQVGAVRKDTSDNNFAGNSITQANFRACTSESNLTNAIIPLVGADLTIDWTDGPSVYVVSVNNDRTFNISNLPTTQYAVMRFIITGDGTPRNVEFSIVNGTVKVESGSTNPVVVTSATDPVVVEVFSYNNTVLFLRTIGSFA
jgi:hypothetical protein